MEKPLVKKTMLTAPVDGKIIALCDVQDDAFASEILGKGCAILPTDGCFHAPISGTISTLFPSRHAIGITSDDGIEVLIHIGLDTVQLNGEGFTALVKQGDHVEQGQPLVNVDLAFVKEKGFCLETPVVITNSAQYLDVLDVAKDTIHAGEDFLHIVK